MSYYLVINLEAVIVLLTFSFNKTNKLFCILFYLGIRKAITTVVPNLFIVQEFRQCRYIHSGPFSQFDWVHI